LNLCHSRACPGNPVNISQSKNWIVRSSRTMTRNQVIHFYEVDLVKIQRKLNMILKTMSSKDLVFQQDPLGVILKSLSILFSKSFRLLFSPTRRGRNLSLSISSFKVNYFLIFFSKFFSFLKNHSKLGFLPPFLAVFSI